MGKHSWSQEAPSMAVAVHFMHCHAAVLVHLCQATGLEHGWHNNDVAAGVDEVAQGLVVAELECCVAAT
jgi:alpha-D-ribose 1-methylphosphonate 5-triphosphate diphosphatase PhnM